jgi:hypothetical protein
LIKVYIDADSEGNIELSLAGTRVIPDKEYQFYFEVEELDFDSFPEKYKVINGELVKGV